MIAIELALTIDFIALICSCTSFIVEIQAGCMRGVRAMLHVFADATDPDRR